ncbi:NifB/NifX family molybdenum-iron cluster-binding protein [Psychromonas ossibalaenae]|uniref:NifB/NifX family molybdenum-iron cluster-binding protein n=1 Tax=Psychromonas ossibalaenae TaxID=444922 RepID=UPI000364F43C|nr:NifB/NifX family molybdenum-iron cluster-binding protein [Psychromonas ossibalaenae]
MIYAIATTEKQLSPRFSKAEIFTFYNELGRVVAVQKNPCLAVSGCTGKKLLIELLKKLNCDVVIVRKIGEKTLAKLLFSGFKVEQGSTRDTTEVLLENARLQKNSLTRPEQGVKSKGSGCSA